ncbi:MAG: hypothetical protein N4A61_11215 [Pelagimonas sp.]|jgi:hypothetical protein|nr:hypothetical protein [Pelagimonas sp.]
MYDARYSARGCGELFAGIITMAFSDAFNPQGSSRIEKELLQHDAILFLTATTGEWRAHRNFLCTAIGIDGDTLAQCIRDMLVGKADPHVRQAQMTGRQSTITFKQVHVDAARAVYAQMHERQAPKPKVAKPASKVKSRTGWTGPPATPNDASILDEWTVNLSAT